MNITESTTSNRTASTKQDGGEKKMPDKNYCFVDIEDPDKTTQDVGRMETKEEEEEEEEDEEPSRCSRFVERIETCVHGFCSKHQGKIKKGVYFFLLLAYLLYFGYCMSYRFGDEGSLILLVVTAMLLWKLLFVFLDYKGVAIRPPLSCLAFATSKRGMFLRKCARYLGYTSALVVVMLYLGLEVFPGHSRNVQSFLGMIAFVLLCYVMSAKPSKVNWHPVFWSFVLQFAVATLCLRTRAGYQAFKWLGDKVEGLFNFSDVGSELVVGKNFRQLGLALSSTGVIIFTNAFVYLMHHWGVIEFIVLKLGRFLAFCLDTGPVESVMAAANIFLGLAEAPLLARPYLATITRSEMHTIMACGFASISGGFMGLFIKFGAPANHLLTATFISAPAALAFAKLMYPEVEKVSKHSQAHIQVKDKTNKRETNSLNAFSEGAAMALTVAAAVWTNMLAFVSMLELLNFLVHWLGERAGVDGLTFDLIFSYLFFPLSYGMGVNYEDCKLVGSLLGIKMITSPAVSYSMLGTIINNRAVFDAYSSNPNNTWHWAGSDVILDATNTTLVNGFMSERSEVITTYAMCGFSTITGIGITLGAFVPLCPSRKTDILRLIMRAFVAGNMANFLTGAIAGVLYSSGNVMSVSH